MKESVSLTSRARQVQDTIEALDMARIQSIVAAPIDRRESLTEIYRREREGDRARLGIERSGLLLQAFFDVAEVWRLDDRATVELLGGTSTELLASWRSSMGKARLGVEHVVRIGQVLGIYLALASLHGEDHAGRHWLGQRSDLPPFFGRTPLDLMRMSDLSEGLVAVRHHVLGLIYGGWG